jgi:hypothetical protein
VVQYAIWHRRNRFFRNLLAALGALLFRIREQLLGPDLGTNWSLIVGSLGFYGVLAWFGLAYGPHVSHLSLPIRMGVPELSRTYGQKTLVRDGKGEAV